MHDSSESRKKTLLREDVGGGGRRGGRGGVTVGCVEACSESRKNSRQGLEGGNYKEKVTVAAPGQLKGNRRRARTVLNRF